LEDRLATLSGSVAVIKVGANSKVELKEKKDRIEDAIYATKAALKEGIVPGGGVALLNISQRNDGILMSALRSPYDTILENAGLEVEDTDMDGYGYNVVNKKMVHMINVGIVDPLLVTKTALKNAVSVALTVMSADCVISNIRINESSK
jgi:chaperonin GroEL